MYDRRFNGKMDGLVRSEGMSKGSIWGLEINVISEPINWLINVLVTKCFKRHAVLGNGN